MAVIPARQAVFSRPVYYLSSKTLLTKSWCLPFHIFLPRTLLFGAEGHGVLRCTCV